MCKIFSPIITTILEKTSEAYLTTGRTSKPGPTKYYMHQEGGHVYRKIFPASDIRGAIARIYREPGFYTLYCDVIYHYQFKIFQGKETFSFHKLADEVVSRFESESNRDDQVFEVVMG